MAKNNEIKNGFYYCSGRMRLTDQEIIATEQRVCDSQFLREEDVAAA